MAFVKWVALSNDGSITLMENSGGTGSTPAKPSPGNPPATYIALAKYWGLWPPAVANLMKYQLYHQSIHRAHTLGWVQYETAIEAAFVSIADGSNVKAALANAQSTLKEDFAALSLSTK
jgi:hypothetical protein